MKAIALRVDECGACHICEMACSLSRAGECNPSKSRIAILRGEMKETILVCQQCEVMFCACVCPTRAIRREGASGVTLVDEDRCTGCRACVSACPYHAVGFDADRKKALICDACSGDPQCVQWCPRGALRYAELDAQHREEKRAGAEQAFSLLRSIGA
jgi:carbon-monoxide dehydrogenase iron sulfur subunit